MTDKENRRRDELARDRDEMARGRDDLARDRDDFSQRATRSARSVQTWATLVVIVMVAGLFVVLQQRVDAIDSIIESAERTEEAATRTEQVLIDILDEQNTPESQAFNQAIRRALNDINDVKQILCDVDEPPQPCTSEP